MNSMQLEAHRADRLIDVIQQGLTACFGPTIPQRPVPGADINEIELADADRSESIALIASSA